MTPTDEFEGVKLYCGDALSVLRTLPNSSVDAIIADPPYGARRPSARRLAFDRFDEVAGNDDVHPAWLVDAFACLADAGALYLFTCWDRMNDWRDAMTEVGLRVRSCVVWDKVVHGLGDLKTCWAPQHEFILFGAKGRHELGGSRPKDVIRVPRVDAKDLVHPYQKPAKVIRELVVTSSKPGSTVLDPFMGSGTTGIACQQLDRNFIGVELDPTHYATALARLRHATGTGPGQLFAAGG